MRKIIWLALAASLTASAASAQTAFTWTYTDNGRSDGLPAGNIDASGTLTLGGPATGDSSANFITALTGTIAANAGGGTVALFGGNPASINQPISGAPGSDLYSNALYLGGGPLLSGLSQNGSGVVLAITGGSYDGLLLDIYAVFDGGYLYDEGDVLNTDGTFSVSALTSWTGTFAITPVADVPEPISLGLLGVGIGMLAAVRRGRA